MGREDFWVDSVKKTPRARGSVGWGVIGVPLVLREREGNPILLPFQPPGFSASHSHEKRT